MRISVYDILDWLASGMTQEDILGDYPELEKEDIEAALRFVGDRERSSYQNGGWMVERFEKFENFEKKLGLETL